MGFAIKQTDLAGRSTKEVAMDIDAELYAQLRDVARRQRQRWSGNNTLDTTSLLHETLANLMERRGKKLVDLDHLLATAAISMRRALVDYAKAQKRTKRGGSFSRVDWVEERASADSPQPFSLLIMAERLERLHAVDERRARVFELRFFFGSSVEETAAILSISPATVKRDWALATTFLRSEFAVAD